MKTIYTLLLMLISGYSLNAQNTFHKYYSIPGSLGMLTRCIQTSDGGYVAAGHVTNTETYLDDFLVIKTNQEGDASWIKRITGPGNDDLNDIMETPEGDFVVVGSSRDLATFRMQAIVEKFDANGTSKWTRTYSIGDGSATARRVMQGPGSEIIILGNVDMPGASSDYFIMKLDADGNIIVQRTIGTPQPDIPAAFIVLPSGDFVIAGWHNSGSGENFHLLRVSPTMVQSWNTLIEGGGGYACNDIALTPDGNILVVGSVSTNMGFKRPLIAKFDASTGDQIWVKNYNSVSELSSSLNGVSVKSADEIGVTGVIEGLTSATLIFGIDGSGNVTWTKQFGGSSTNDYTGGYCISGTSWWGYVVCGPNDGPDNSIAHLVSLDGNGETSCPLNAYPLTVIPMFVPAANAILTSNMGPMVTQIATYTEANSSGTGAICLGLGTADTPPAGSGFTVYPNPSAGKFSVTLSEPLQDGTLTLYNAAGIAIFRKAGLNSVQGGVIQDIDMRLPSGIYWVELNTGGARMAEKLVINKR